MQYIYIYSKTIYIYLYTIFIHGSMRIKGNKISIYTYIYLYIYSKNVNLYIYITNKGTTQNYLFTPYFITTFYLPLCDWKKSPSQRICHIYICKYIYMYIDI